VLSSRVGSSLLSVTIRLFGGFEVQWEHGPLLPVRTQKGRWLLALLALHSDRKLEREWVAETFWPDSQNPRENLKRCLTDLRTAMGSQADRILSPSRDLLSFDSTGVDIDVAQFDRAIAEAKRLQSVSALGKAVAVYRGPVLEGWTADWINAERGWRAQAALEALEKLGDQAVLEGAYPDALAYAGQAIGIDPLHEAAYRIAMYAHAGGHDLAAVRRTLKQLEARLRREFGGRNVRPDPLTIAVHDTLLAAARAPDTGIAVDLPKHNLPGEARRFIGRSQVRAELAALVRGGSRLVTVTGIGGMGKSHLARQVAFDLIGEFPDGVWLVDCHALRDGADVVGAICAALRLQQGAGGGEKALHRALHTRKTLLVLDGFESVVTYAASLEALLKQCSQLQYLITSRHALGLNREVQVPLEPMVAGPEDSENETEAEGVALFLESGRHVQRDFEVNAADRDLVEQICNQVDGIPLAIILAAGFLRTLSPAELLSVVQERRFEVLKRRAVGEDDRHADLQRVIAESILALEAAEQRYLRRMSIFVGGFDYMAAREVCAEAGSDGGDLLDLLVRLQDHSLLIRRGLPARLQLLDTVRECLAAKDREADFETAREMADCRFRHAAYYVPLAQRIHNLIVEEGRWAEGIDLLWRDLGNLRAAINYCITNSRDDLLIEYARTLARTLAEMGLTRDFNTLVQAAEQAAQRHKRPDVLADMLALRGAVARRDGREEDAQDCWERRLELLRQTGSPVDVADALFDLAGQTQARGDRKRCRSLIAQGLQLARIHKMPDALATGHVRAAQIALTENRPLQANRRAERALHVVSLGVNRLVAVYAWIMLGKMYVQMNNFEQAEELLRRAVAAGCEGRRAFEVGYTLLELGALYERQKRVRSAALAFLAAHQIHTQLATPMQPLAEEELRRFRQSHDLGDLLEWMDRQQRASWLDLAASMLKDA
jgi:predicted ATPase/DNA-binding SARP family transcriptional activator